jgi:ADP-ribose pyrophosphatase
VGGPPFEVVSSRELCRHGRYELHADQVAWPDGTRTTYGVLRQPDAALIVPVSERGTTFLVRQWRHSWAAAAWEVPAGTVEHGEDPLATARRELAEEAGLAAAEWEPLGTARASAISTMQFHLYLARELSAVERRPEIYEQDMMVRELPFEEALALAADGTVEHAASVTALFRADRLLRT